MKAFIEKIELYPEKRADGCWIKHITFNFPIPLDGKEVPIYQKKCTMLNAFCQSIKSWWSINSIEENREYAKKALSGIIEYMDSYIENKEDENKQMIAANYAGRAICISQTTAVHAMSCKLTSLYIKFHIDEQLLCVCLD